MRNLLLFSLLVISGIAAARELHVVVHTRDREVTKYVCEDRMDEKGTLAQRTVLRSAGGVSWHAVGGVAPYTVIHSDIDRIGNVCITLMDATGAMATGCGIMVERVRVLGVPCGSEQLDTCQVKLPEVNSTTHCSIYRPDPKPDPRTDRPHRKNGKDDPKPKPVKWTERRSIDRDVRDPSPAPRPTASHDRGTRTGGGGTYRDPARPVDRGISSGGSGSRSGSTSSGARSGGSSGASGSRSLIHQHYGNTGR